jgi:hypothetical protein
VIGGDFNFASANIDRGTGTLMPGDTVYNRILKEIFEMLGVKDTFRESNPGVKSLTYHRGQSRSRIDRNYSNMEIENVQHVPVAFSDHQAVMARIKDKEKQDRGRGFWKLKVSLQKDERTRQEVMRFWEEWGEKKETFRSPSGKWAKRK